MGDYDTDIVEWSERQAMLLRNLADGKKRLPANDTPDWRNIIDEVESVGRSELHAVESLLTQVMLHRLKLQAWPQSTAAAHRQREARVLSRQAARQFTPSMRAKIDPAALHDDAVDRLPDWIDDRVPPLPVPAECPFTVDGLLDHSSCSASLTGTLDTASSGPSM